MSNNDVEPCERIIDRYAPMTGDELAEITGTKWRFKDVTERIQPDGRWVIRYRFKSTRATCNGAIRHEDTMMRTEQATRETAELVVYKPLSADELRVLRRKRNWVFISAETITQGAMRYVFEILPDRVERRA